jgi:hypothetical protein
MVKKFKTKGDKKLRKLLKQINDSRKQSLENEKLRFHQDKQLLKELEKKSRSQAMVEIVSEKIDNSISLMTEMMIALCTDSPLLNVFNKANDYMK